MAITNIQYKNLMSLYLQFASTSSGRSPGSSSNSKGISSTVRRPANSSSSAEPYSGMTERNIDTAMMNDKQFLNRCFIVWFPFSIFNCLEQYVTDQSLSDKLFLSSRRLNLSLREFFIINCRFNPLFFCVFAQEVRRERVPRGKYPQDTKCAHRSRHRWRGS